MGARERVAWSGKREGQPHSNAVGLPLERPTRYAPRALHLEDATIRSRLEPPNGAWRSQDGRRDAAVLAPIVTTEDGDAILFTKRRADLKHHAGELSFPGGGREAEEDAIECALRETHEEIGLVADRIDLLGSLPDRMSIAGYQVHVLVGRMDGLPDIVLDTREVDKLVVIPVAELRRANRWEYRDLEDRNRRRWKVPFFEHDSETLWGLTARFTLDLLERVANLKV